MGTVGIVHTGFAFAALILGAAVVTARKGSRLHRAVGRVYVSLMVGVNATAFGLYGLFGRMGPFHVLALVSLATLVAGLVPVLLRRPRATWLGYHARFMAWSYVGLLAAAAAELMVRLPRVPFVPGVLGASVGVTLAGAAVIHGRRGAIISAAIRRAGVRASPGRSASRSTVATIALACTCVAGLTVQASAQAAASPSLSTAALATRDSAVILLDAGVIRRDADRIARAHALLEQLVRTTAPDGLTLFWFGYAMYRAAELPRAASVARAPHLSAEELLDSAAIVLGRSAELRPLPETWALLGTITGLRMRGAVWRALLTSGRWRHELNTAERLGPANPRVLLLRGINAYHAPARFGGGDDATQRYIERSIAAFADDRPGPGLPAWGHAEALAWLGRLHARRGDRDAARAAYLAALALEPGYVWVRDVLLPGLARPDVPPLAASTAPKPSARSASGARSCADSRHSPPVLRYTYTRPGRKLLFGSPMISSSSPMMTELPNEPDCPATEPAPIAIRTKVQSGLIPRTGVCPGIRRKLRNKCYTGVPISHATVCQVGCRGACKDTSVFLLRPCTAPVNPVPSPVPCPVGSRLMSAAV